MKFVKIFLKIIINEQQKEQKQVRLNKFDYFEHFKI